MTSVTSHQENDQTLCVKLGIIQRKTCTLKDASAIIESIFTEHGYDIRTFKTRPAHHVELQCSHYTIDLKHRRSIAPIRMTDGSPCKSHLDVSITPHFPQAVDREISEILMVRCLQALVEAITDATSVFWLNEPQAISRREFLSLFEAELYVHATMQPDLITPRTIVNTSRRNRAALPAPTPLADAKYFEPIEQNLNDLELHCNQLIASVDPINTSSLSIPTAQSDEPEDTETKPRLKSGLHSLLKAISSLAGLTTARSG